LSAPIRRVISVTAPSRPGMNGPATLYGAEGLRALCELSAWIRVVGGEPAEQRVERDRVTVVRRPPPRP
jgi:hypothetical protein